MNDRLTKKQVDKIRFDFNNDRTLTQTALAKEYDVVISTINHILQNTTWYDSNYKRTRKSLIDEGVRKILASNRTLTTDEVIEGVQRSTGSRMANSTARTAQVKARLIERLDFKSL